ncbi:MAG TPA: DUF389 domain-containing protein [Tepidisphaeraceae bacterium]|nr:DUF389 domain-containing protein [Tepidisphaeraceae bacterium]
MARTIEITAATEVTDQLQREVQDLPGLISLRVQRNISLQPPGDVLAVEATSNGIMELMRRLDARQLTSSPGVSIRLTQPAGIISSSHVELIVRDDSEATWEEMEVALARETNMTLNGLLIMLLAGFIAAMGINSNGLHLVIGAMVIAPGFGPLTRMALGMVAGSGGALWRGLVDTARGYAAMILGAAIAGLVLRAAGETSPGGDSSYFQPETLIGYWTQPTLQSYLVSATAAAAGAVLVAAHRTVLTTGVMIALALVPAATIIGMSLAWARFDLAAQGAFRWLIEVALVVVLSALVLLWKRLRGHKRTMTL